MKNMKFSNRALAQGQKYRLTRLYLGDIKNIINNFQKTKSISR